MQVLGNFYEEVDMKMIRSIWSPWRNETDATATNPKMMSQQHIGSDNSLRYRCKRASVRMCGTCKRWWGDPGYRVPHVLVAWQKRGITSDNSITVQTRASHTTHAFVHGRRLGIIPLKRAFLERFEFGAV